MERNGKITSVACRAAKSPPRAARDHKTQERTNCAQYRIGSVLQNHDNERNRAVPPSQNAQKNPTAPGTGLALFRKMLRTQSRERKRVGHFPEKCTNKPNRAPHRIGSVSQNRQDERKRANSLSQDAQTNPTTRTSDWLCFAKSPQRPKPSQPAIAKRTIKPNRTEPNYGISRILEISESPCAS